MLLLRLRFLQTPDATRVALLAVVFATISRPPSWCRRRETWLASGPRS